MRTKDGTATIAVWRKQKFQCPTAGCGPAVTTDQCGRGGEGREDGRDILRGRNSYGDLLKRAESIRVEERGGEES